LEINIDAIKRNTGTIVDASKDVGLEIDVKKTKYVLLSHQNQDIKTAKRSF
jgi:hypothetical protein